MRIICVRPLKRNSAYADDSSILKGLRENEFYYFYEGYDIRSNSIDLTGRIVPDDLYNPKRYAHGKTNATFSVDICAIVGQNGAGKSTLVDIYIRVINNLATYVFGEDFLFPKAEHLHFIRGLFAEVYLEVENSIYCICCKDLRIKVVQYDINLQKTKYQKQKQDKLSASVNANIPCKPHPEYLELLKGLCYNTILNYSLHSYNSSAYKKENTNDNKELKIRKDALKSELKLYRPDFIYDKDGDVKELTIDLLQEHFPEGFSWLSGVFHKNDGFHTPLVITPKREYGMININKENDLSEERMISLLFVENNAEDNDQTKRFPFSEINSKLKIVGITIFNNDDVINKYETRPVFHPDLPDYSTDLLSDLQDYIRGEYEETFHLKEVERDYKEAALNYLVAKTIKIFMTYPRFDVARLFLININNRLQKTDKKKIRKYLEDLWNDHTHIVTKLRRTLNYLRYEHIGANRVFTTEQLASRIDVIVGKERKKDKYPPVETDEMLPPPIFKVDFHLFDVEDDGKQNIIPFSTLSSGEKQITYILCSLYYYMLCIDSAHRYYHDYKKIGEQIEYKHINVVFDEIELYFHPEMQRSFVHTLLHGLQQLPFKFIKSLHFMIVTHSPFILSDIPKQNILFLRRNGEKASHVEMASFGANIHTMLLNSFFLTGGTMGQFARDTINTMINQVNLYYLWKKKKEYKNNMETLKAFNFPIYKSLPEKFKTVLEGNSYDETMIDWDFIENMADVIQEPIVRNRFKEILERRKADVDN